MFKKNPHITSADLLGIDELAKFNVSCRSNRSVTFDLDQQLIEVKSDTAREKIAEIINAAIDAKLVQRVFAKSESVKNKYPLKKMPDGKVWMTQNLREKVEGAVWNQDYNCYLYTWEQAKKAVPKGFHLPTLGELVTLCECFGYGYKPDKEVIERLQKEFNLTFSGYVDTYGSLRAQGSYGYWWTSTQATAGHGYYLSYFSSGGLNPAYAAARHDGIAVRCIKND